MLEAAINEWAIGLAGLSGDNIKRGLDKCRTDCKWPPSIAEFLDLAMERGTWEHTSPAYRENEKVKALPRPRNIEASRAHLERLRGVLNAK